MIERPDMDAEAQYAHQQDWSKRQIRGMMNAPRDLDPFKGRSPLDWGLGDSLYPAPRESIVDRLKSWITGR